MAEAETKTYRALKFVAFGGVLAALAIVPFILFGAAFEAFSFRMIDRATSELAIALAGIALLAADVVLPIPSTIVVTALGALLGAVNGTLAAVTGLTLGCALGYWLGRKLGHDFALRQLGEEDFATLASLFKRHGLPILALCRPVPVLAEASVIAAGVLGLPAGRTLLVTLLANLGFAGVYATLGAAADSVPGLILVFTASLAIPALALLISKRARSAARTGSPGDGDRDTAA